MRAFAWISFCLVIGVGVAAQAQPYWGGWGGWGGGYRHASTAAEGAARGLADVIRSAGAANLMHSEAAKNYEDARRKHIENRLQWTNTYFEMKRVNQEYRDATRRPPPTQEQLIRFSKMKLPDRLTASQLDPLTGNINWPMALRMQPYEEYRNQLGKIYADRAEHGYLTPDQYLQVKQISKDMLAQLRESGRDLPSNLRIEARKFIEGLSFEANMQPG